MSKLKEGLVGFKPNLKFYQGEKGRETLVEISQNIGPQLIRMLDAKSSDGANTNLAELKEYSPYFEYVTIAPAAGCIEETIEKATDSNQNTISMGAMSFPGILREINLGLPLFKQRVDRAIEAGTSAFVLGATPYVPQSEFDSLIQKYRTLTSDKPITKQEMSDDQLYQALEGRNELFEYILQQTQNKDILYLVPGFGRQGGNLEYFLSSGIDLNKCMINAGSDILKAQNPLQALKEMNSTFNSYRK